MPDSGQRSELTRARDLGIGRGARRIAELRRGGNARLEIDARTRNELERLTDSRSGEAVEAGADEDYGIDLAFRERAEPVFRFLFEKYWLVGKRQRCDKQRRLLLWLALKTLDHEDLRQLAPHPGDPARRRALCLEPAHVRRILPRPVDDKDGRRQNRLLQ